MTVPLDNNNGEVITGQDHIVIPVDGVVQVESVDQSKYNDHADVLEKMTDLIRTQIN